MSSGMELVGKTISELQRLLKDKQISAKELAECVLNHIQHHDKDTHAFLCVTEELAFKQAAEIDATIARGDALPALGGIPVTIKDNISVQGYATTCGSKILEHFSPPYDATAARLLFASGAVCVGKGNMDEFAMGSSSENTAYDVVRNPWNFNRVPGGSSGGPAVAVAAGYSTVSLGSDTGGSIRQPAALCGVVGMKPTYGLVSRYGLVAFASSLDQIGPFGLCVEDVALTLAAICGTDPRDSTSIVDPFGGELNKKGFPRLDLDFARGLADKTTESICRGLKVGVIKELLADGLEPEVKKSVEDAVKVYADAGAEIIEIEMPYLKHSLPVYYIIATAEASANLARYDGVRYGERDKQAQDLLSMYNSTRQHGFGAEVKRRIMLGTYALSSGYYDAYYKKAQQVRRLIKNDFDAAFEKVDVLVSPTSPTVAFEIGEKTDDPLTMYLSDIATIPVNLAGLPGISVPCGFGAGNLPIGLQLLGPQLSDAKLLEIARAYENATEFTKKRSPLIEAACVAS